LLDFPQKTLTNVLHCGVVPDILVQSPQSKICGGQQDEILVNVLQSFGKFDKLADGRFDTAGGIW
jgi:hypothetical protein